jgi:hypothetical protein
MGGAPHVQQRMLKVLPSRPHLALNVGGTIPRPFCDDEVRRARNHDRSKLFPLSVVTS